MREEKRQKKVIRGTEDANPTVSQSVRIPGKESLLLLSAICCPLLLSLSFLSNLCASIICDSDQEEDCCLSMHDILGTG